MLKDDRRVSGVGRMAVWVCLPAAMLAGAAVPAPPGTSPAVTAATTTPLRLHRTWLPKASPSSFAVGFGGGLNACFDPMRANVIYAWEGDYVDLQPTVNGKIPRDALLRGRIFHEDIAPSGFRSGARLTTPEIRFTGHRLKEGCPEFHYEVDGIAVTELLQPSPDGNGLIRRIRVTTADQTLVFLPPPGSRLALESGPGAGLDSGLRIPGHATVVFTVHLRRP